MGLYGYPGLGIQFNNNWFDNRFSSFFRPFRWIYSSSYGSLLFSDYPAVGFRIICTDFRLLVRWRAYAVSFPRFACEHTHPSNIVSGMYSATKNFKFSFYFSKWTDNVTLPDIERGFDLLSSMFGLGPEFSIWYILVGKSCSIRIKHEHAPV